MAKSCWALDIGQWSLKVVKGAFDSRSGKIRIDLFDVIPYGELRCGQEAPDLQRYREALRVFRDRYEVGKRDDLLVSVTGNEVFSRFINLPPVGDRIGAIIRYEARQQIPFDIDDVVWDYQPIKEEYELGEEIEVGLFAVKRERINEFMEMLEPWQRNLRVLQDAPLSVYNFLQFEGRTDRPLIVLDIGSHTTDVIVLNHPRFWVRPLLVAGDQITKALQESFDVSYQDAETMKQRAAQTGRQQEVLEAIRPVVGEMTSEIQRSLGYYKSLDRRALFERVLILGNAFKLRGLARVLAEGLQYELEQLDTLNNFVLSPSIDRNSFLAHLPGACAVLGLLVQGTGRGRIRINLVPETVVTRMELERKKPWVFASVVGLWLIVIGLFVSERVYSRELANNYDIGEPQLNQISRFERDYGSKEGELGRLETKLQGLTSGTVDRDLLLRLVHLIANELPVQVHVTNLEVMWLEPREVDRCFHQMPRQGDDREPRMLRSKPMGRGRGAGPAEAAPGMPGMTGMPGMPGMPGMTGEPERMGRERVVITSVVLERMIERGETVSQATLRGMVDGGVKFSPELIKKLEDSRMEIAPDLLARIKAGGGPGEAAPLAVSGARAGEGLEFTQPLSSPDARLVVLLDCESRMVLQPEVFIKQDVIEKLKKVTFERDKVSGERELAFEEVGLIQDFADVYRLAVSGVESAGPTDEQTLRGRGRARLLAQQKVEEEEIHFVAFSCYGILKGIGGGGSATAGVTGRPTRVPTRRPGW